MADLLPHQELAAEQLLAIVSRAGFGYLAGEVRSGKTRTAMAVCRSLDAGDVLFVTKKRAIASIQSDAEAMEMAGRVNVINYESVHKVINRKWCVLIVDEAHGIGAYPKPSLRFKRLKELQFKALILMSGTPSPESYSQLFHQLALARMPQNPWLKYRNFYSWAKDYVNVREKFIGQDIKVKDYSVAIKEKVLADFEPFKVTMTQADAGIRTRIIEDVHRVAMSAATHALARAIDRHGVAVSAYGWSVVADTGAKQLSKLRQIWSGTVITEDDGAVIVDHSKAEYIFKHFAKKKVAILYTFQAERRMLLDCLDGSGITPVETPEQFCSTGPEFWYVGQVQASREGVNLSAATDLVFLGIDYSALSYIQGRDRSTHINRTMANRVHWILAASSLELDVFATVQKKEDFTLAHYKRKRA